MSDDEFEPGTKHDHEHVRTLSKGLRAGLDATALRKNQGITAEAPPPPLPAAVELEDLPSPLGNRDWFPMPETFDSFVGQDRTRLLLRSLAYVENQTRQATPPILLCARPGSGKRTLAHLYSREVPKPLVIHSPSTILDKTRLANLLSNNELTGKILLLEHIDKLPAELSAILFTASVGGLYSINSDPDDNDNRVTGRASPFTLICTCDDPFWDLDGPIRSRFAYDPAFTTKYTSHEVSAILIGFCIRNGLQLDQEAALMIADAAEMELPKSMALLRWIIAYTLGAKSTAIDEPMSREALSYY